MEIVCYPHPALRWKSRPLVEIDSNVESTVRQMFDLMYEAKGIGLAANQVGLPWRLFILNLTGDPAEKAEELVFINPRFLRRKGTQTAEEGCLSFPKLYGEVERASEVVLEAFGLDGEGFEMTAKELASRAVQHEYDHLEGVLFVDKMTADSLEELRPKLADLDALYRRRQELGTLPSDEAIRAELERMEQRAPLH